jgi:glycosyltransferase involved in cell wall biosynthesis
VKYKEKPTVTILIPSINEGRILTKVAKDCRKVTDYKITILIILSDKSTKTTKEEAKKTKEKIINIGNRLGKGTAIKFAIPHIKTDYTVQIDADYQFVPNEIPKLMNPLLNGYDVSLGTRYQKGAKIDPDSVSWLRLFGSYAISLATSLFSQKRVTDVMAGFKAFKTPVLKALNPQTNHFGYEAELVVRAAKRGYKIINIPISYKKRTVGKSSLDSIKHGLLVLNTIVKTSMEKN